MREAPSGQKLQALGANIISRCFGLMIRLVLIISGIVALIIHFLLSVILIILWPFLPLMPAIAIMLSLMKVGV